MFKYIQSFTPLIFSLLLGFSLGAQEALSPEAKLQGSYAVAENLIR